MSYLSLRAALHYLALVRVSYFSGLIDWSEAMDRLSSLKTMCAPEDPTYKYVSRVLQLEQYDLCEDWNETEAGEQASDSDLAGTIHSTQQGDDDSIIYFVPGPATGLSSWTFHPFDPDFRPSVPHGHRANQKLHAYQGWIYQGSRQLGREPRKSIIALWNDNAFRGIAARAINYYLTNHPSYTGWRVSNPRRLPRKRP